MVIKKNSKKAKAKRKIIKKRPIKKKTAKKAIKKKPFKKKEKKIGEITHFYGKIKVAVVKLNAPLKIGDRIKIQGGEREFEQTVKSIEVEHKKIKRAKAKQIIGLKIKDKVRDGYKVYKLS